MSDDDLLCHTSSAEVAVPAERAFDYMSDGLKQSEWALGSWNRRKLDDGTFVGTSLFDGKETFVRIESDRRWLLVQYSVGRSPDSLRPLVSARVVDGPATGRPADTCVVTLMVWRAADQPEDVWRRTHHAFFAEIAMIKGRLEQGF
jgi:hypothetical protein